MEWSIVTMASNLLLVSQQAHVFDPTQTTGTLFMKYRL